ncbi:MAG: hypothetical protein JSW18_02520 [Candidatus Omnitrophota bacterium]|nr:MAG: hypothetical protein JSW18_02520 [Candidatus Omnitrophota bacterium]
MQIAAQKIKIFKIKNRKGYAAVCFDRLTEGTTTYQAYDRMLKALRRGGIIIKKHPSDLKHLVTSIQ